MIHNVKPILIIYSTEWFFLMQKIYFSQIMHRCCYIQLMRLSLQYTFAWFECYKHYQIVPQTAWEEIMKNNIVIKLVSAIGYYNDMFFLSWASMTIVVYAFVSSGMTRFLKIILQHIGKVLFAELDGNLFFLMIAGEFPSKNTTAEWVFHAQYMLCIFYNRFFIPIKNYSITFNKVCWHTILTVLWHIQILQKQTMVNLYSAIIIWSIITSNNNSFFQYFRGYCLVWFQ